MRATKRTTPDTSKAKPHTGPSSPSGRNGTPRPSFEEFAATQRKAGTECWFCSIPERGEIERAVLSGRATKAAAWRWLRDVCGYEEATRNRVDNHFATHVSTP